MSLNNVLIRLFNPYVKQKTTQLLYKRSVIIMIILVTTFVIIFCYFYLWYKQDVVQINSDPNGQPVRISSLTIKTQYKPVNWEEVNFIIYYQGDIRVANKSFIKNKYVNFGDNLWMFDCQFTFNIQNQRSLSGCVIQNQYNCGNGLSSLMVIYDDDCGINKFITINYSSLSYSVNNGPAGILVYKDLNGSLIERIENLNDWKGFHFIWYNFLLILNNNTTKISNDYINAINSEILDMTYYNKYSISSSAIDAFQKAISTMPIIYSLLILISGLFISNKDDGYILLN
jgi:hypothetical protein